MSGRFTEKGLTLIEKASKYGMSEWLDPYSGNFGFTEKQFSDNTELIKKWLRENTEYFLLYQYCDDESPCWFVTDWLE